VKTYKIEINKVKAMSQGNGLVEAKIDALVLPMTARDDQPETTLLSMSEATARVMFLLLKAQSGFNAGKCFFAKTIEFCLLKQGLREHRLQYSLHELREGVARNGHRDGCRLFVQEHARGSSIAPGQRNFGNLFFGDWILRISESSFDQCNSDEVRSAFFADGIVCGSSVEHDLDVV
jgi:hypothetical protein